MGGGELGSGRGEVGVVGFVGIVAGGGWVSADDGYPLGEDFINEGRGFSPTHRIHVFL